MVTTDIYRFFDYLYMNWGWGSNTIGGPNNDGWYNCAIDYTTSPAQITASNPNGIGLNFQYFQIIITNIHR